MWEITQARGAKPLRPPPSHGPTLRIQCADWCVNFRIGVSVPVLCCLPASNDLLEFADAAIRGRAQWEGRSLVIDLSV